jgi:hypothetical protein
MPTARAQWFAHVIRAGLDTRVIAESDVLAHATPAILIAALPRDVMIKVLDGALTAGTISPQSVMQTATPELVAEHVAPAVVWGCIASAAERAGITKPTGDGDGPREMLKRALASGLDTGVLTPKMIVDHVDAKVIGHHFPDPLTTKLLETSLAAGKMNPELIVQTLGVDAIAKHAPTAVVWACLAKAGTDEPAVIIAELPPKAAAVLLDDDVASVLVDLEESGMLDMPFSSKPEPKSSGKSPEPMRAKPR